MVYKPKILLNAFKLLIIYALSITSVMAKAQPIYEIEADFFPNEARMHGYLVDSRHFMKGKTKISNIQKATDDIVLYLHGELYVDSVLYNGKSLEFKQEKTKFDYNYSLLATKVTIKNPSNAGANSVEIFYRGFINASRARSLSDYMRIDKNEGVFLRAYGYSLWFPVLENMDNPLYEANFKQISVSLPKEFRAIVSGIMINEENTAERYKSTWAAGLKSVIDIQCTARKYQSISKNNVHVYFMNDEPLSEKVLNYTLQLKTLFEEKFRPIDKDPPVYIMEMPKYGNISGSNVIGISDELFASFDSNIWAKSTLAHELIHSYVKIPVGYENPFVAMVYEGFPSFFQVYALHKTIDDSKYSLKKDMQNVESAYLKKRTTGLTESGRKLPVEKPILDIRFDEIGTYKDKFVLSDRVWLFLYSLWQKMGDEKFDAFIKELFSLQTLDYKTFSNLVEKYLPDSAPDIFVWLKTTEFPDRFKMKL